MKIGGCSLTLTNTNVSFLSSCRTDYISCRQYQEVIGISVASGEQKQEIFNETHFNEHSISEPWACSE